MNKVISTLILLMAVSLLFGCSTSNGSNHATTPSSGLVQPPTPLPSMSVLSIRPGETTTGIYITLDSGGDADTIADSAGSPTNPVRKTGNNQALSSGDGNSTPDQYMQFHVDDHAMFNGNPTTSIRLDVEYFDQGTDSFLIQYDGTTGGPYGDGTYLETHPVYKTDSRAFKTSTFILKDIYFGNRDNGADFRISDQGDGSELIRKVSITLLPIPKIINVDSCGANPFDDQPDSQAIQTCVDQARDGNTITFTSGENTPNYVGYLVDKTIMLEEVNPYRYLTFTSSDPSNPALLKATADLKGFVVRLFARSRITNPGSIDYITISSLHLDGNREERVCLGPDGISNGEDDNWGSWLPECTVIGDSWCLPGTLDLNGAMDWDDTKQDYTGHPNRWSTGHFAYDLVITNTECGTAFGLGDADSVIMNNTIDTAGDHVHGNGCVNTDQDGDFGGWSDGITFMGPANQVINNTITNPSDVGIVFFGGRETVIRGNTVQATSGNNGAFAGIAIHPWSIGNIAYGQVVDNTVVNEGDQTCGGIHAGINIGPHMWGGGCSTGRVNAVGNATCSDEPVPPKGRACSAGGLCQIWAYLPADTTYLFTGNQVTGANINYLVEGLDLQGTLIENNNLSTTPRRTDWAAARGGCGGIYWGALDKVAHHPSLPGWTDMRIHCER